MTLDLSQFHEVFFEEAAEHLADMERRLVGLDLGDPDPEGVNGVFRAAHSIKGGANMFGFGEIAEVTHEMETLLDAARRGKLRLSRAIVDAALGARDYLLQALSAARAGGKADGARAARVAAGLRALAAQGAPAAAGGPRAAAGAGAKGAAGLEIAWPGGRERGAEEVNRLAEQIAQLAGLPAEALAEFAGRLQAEGRAQLALPEGADAARIQEALAFVLPEDCVRLAPAQPAAADFGFFDENLPEPLRAADAGGEGAGAEAARCGSADAAALNTSSAGAGAQKHVRRSGDRRVGDVDDLSIRVSAQKIDRLINLTGELMIGVSMVRGGAGADLASTSSALGVALAAVERNMRELQEAALSIRMIPIGGVFARFPRLVRDLSARLGKEVELRVEGEATELDRGLVEKLVDPLTHLVRNSLDHGIEPPAARAAAGKDPRGTVWLRARHESGSVVIEVVDDGGGLSRDKILRRARELGMHVDDTAGDAAVWELIFAPGFSTADAVSDVSGRGVGMDVVRRNVRELGGHVEVSSRAGEGTRMTIRLPLTLAIMDGMELAVGGEIYILPLNAIVESLRPAPGELKSIGGAQRALNLRGEVLPVLALGETLGAAGTRSPEEGVLVVVESGGRRTALAADELLGQQQVVVKNLEANFRKVQGVAGATILGSGAVALILDVQALVRLASGAEAAREKAA